MLQQYIEHWYRDGMNEYLCMYVLVRIVVVVVPLYGPWDGVVVQDVSKKMGAPSGFRYIAVFYLLANTGTTLDRGTNCKVLAGSLLWISHHMRSCVTKLPVLAILASTGSIPRNSDTAPPRPRRTPPDFTGLRRGLASAWPRHKGLPFVEIVTMAWCVPKRHEPWCVYVT